MNQRHQEPLIGLAALMRMAYSGVDLGPLGAELLARAERNPDDANALMDLSTLLQLRGNREIALATQLQALGMQQIYSPPTAAGEAKIKVLAILAPGDLMTNTPLEFLLESSDIALDLLYVGSGLPPVAALPDHDVLFIAVGESDQTLPLLKELENVAASWPRPVLNQPERIAQMSRDAACALLKSTPGVVMPVTLRIDRKTLQRIGEEGVAISTVLEDGAFPVIVRPVDSHAGQGLEKLDDVAAITAYLLTMPQEEFYISRFIDYRAPDGLFRKYRIVLIDGRPFLCHLAISQHWMVHYLNAGMAEKMAEGAEKRAEEARCMAGFDTDFAQRHAAALRAIYERTGLDYLGIDCGESPDGKLLIFEVDNNMIVHAIDPVDVFPYKQPQMQKVFAAFRGMLVDTAQQAFNPDYPLEI
jgi:glutathione synthase/RimK-type ligase-like ATP-grasp enzyme